MILDTKSGDADIMKSKFNDVAVLLKGGNRYFILADVEESKELLEVKSFLPHLSIDLSMSF